MRRGAVCRTAVAPVLAGLLLAYAAGGAVATSPSPSPSPARDAADKPRESTAAEHTEGSVALAAAATALAKARADLIEAQRELAAARAALAAARQIAEQAQTDLDAAVLAEERTSRELVDVQARLEERRHLLGQLARQAYQNNGAMGDWALVLSSTTPDQLAGRLAFLQSVGNAGNSLIAQLSEDRAELVNVRQRLQASRQLAEQRRDEADRAVRNLTATELLALAAEQQVETVVTAREAAYEAARQAVIEDQRRYRVLVTQSGALGARINALAKDLASQIDDSTGAPGFVLPGVGPVTSPFGPRYHPILHYVKVHTGTDFGVGDGVVYAAEDGVVLLTEFNVAYGNMTVVGHGVQGGRQISTLYAHQAAVGVKAGDVVTKGQAIGVVGSTGYSTGPHLHFEVRVDGEPVDPMPFLAEATPPAGAKT